MCEKWKFHTNHIFICYNIIIGKPSYSNKPLPYFIKNEYPQDIFLWYTYSIENRPKSQIMQGFKVVFNFAK